MAITSSSFDARVIAHRTKLNHYQLMHIVNVIQCTNLGGMERASLRLMSALQARGHSFEVLSLNPIGGLGPLLEEAGIPATGLNYRRGARGAVAIALRRAVSAAGADALILTGHNFAATLALAGVGPRRRLFAMHYHHENVMPAWRWRLIYHAAIAQFQTITFPSDFVRLEAEALCGAVKRVGLTVRNPLEPPIFASDEASNRLRNSMGIPQAAPLIGNAGWLIRRKRFDVFIDTAARILEHRPDAHFIIAGDGEERPALEAQVESFGIARHVHFTGWLTDLGAFYGAIDVLLFNSDWDCFPTTPLEAMASSIPVVASVEHGGLAEVLDEGTGWLLPRHDSYALAANVVAALGEQGIRRASAARERVLTMSDPEHIASVVESRLLGKAYAEVI